ncbi:MAG TPA: DUF3131 domain-containing protein [Thermoanaerobaculia bacterium]
MFRSAWIAVLLVFIGSADASQQPKYLYDAASATWASILAMVEPATGLPRDTLNRVYLDLYPQLAPLRWCPNVSTATGASLVVTPCALPECRHRGSYGARFDYAMPSMGTYGSYELTPGGQFDVSAAEFIELSGKGALGNERFEIVLWSDCSGSFPGRPVSGAITLSTDWQRFRIPLRDYMSSNVRIDSLCRVVIGFNDALHRGGTIYLDDIVFVRADGSRIHIAHDEETSTSNIGLYLPSVVAAKDLGLISETEMLARLGQALASIEALSKTHGFPQTHNHIVSLRPDAAQSCIAFVDTGNLAVGLVVVRNAVPQVASRASALLEAMDWEWAFDPAVGLPHGCRFADQPPTGHYDFYAADSHGGQATAIGSGKMPASSWDHLMRPVEAARCASKPHFGPGWLGGGLFMQALPALVLDTSRTPLGSSLIAFIEDQICYAKNAGAVAWGFSATVPPQGCTYCGYGCPLNFIAPHASMLVAGFVFDDVLRANLEALDAAGARPSVNDGVNTYDFGYVSSISLDGTVQSPVFLVFDQEMAFLGAANRLTGGGVRRYFCQDALADGIRRFIPEYANACRPRGRSVRH